MNDEPTLFTIVFDRKLATQLIDAVDAASRPPNVMFREDMEAMRKEASDKHFDDVLNLLRTLKQSNWWNGLEYFAKEQSSAPSTPPDNNKTSPTSTTGQ